MDVVIRNCQEVHLFDVRLKLSVVLESNLASEEKGSGKSASQLAISSQSNQIKQLPELFVIVLVRNSFGQLQWLLLIILQAKDCRQLAEDTSALARWNEQFQKKPSRQKTSPLKFHKIELADCAQLASKLATLYTPWFKGKD